MLRLFLGAVLIGFAPILVKAVSIGPALSSVYRTGLGGAIFLPYCLWRLYQIKQQNPQALQVSRQLLFYLMFSGVLLAVDFFAWHRSVVYLGAGLSTLLSNTQAFYLAIFGVFFLGEGWSWKFVLALLLGFVGMYLAVDIDTTVVDLPNYDLGVAFGLATGFLWAGFILAFKKLERITPEIGVIIKFVIVLFVAATVGSVLAFFAGEAQTPTKLDMIWLVLLAIGPQVLGWTLIAQSLPKVPLSLAGLVLLVQPIVALVLGVLIFEEPLNYTQSFGVALALAGIYLGSLRAKAPHSIIPQAVS